MPVKDSNRAAIVLASGVVTLLTASLSYAGMLFDITLFKSVLPGLIQMNSVTALNFILLGGILIVIYYDSEVLKNTLLIRFLSLLIFSFSSLSFITLLLKINISVDNILPLSLRSSSMMSPLAAVLFIFISISLLFIYSRNKNTVIALQCVFLLSGFYSLIVILGYLYNITAFYSAGTDYPMALNTAILFLLNCTGLLFINKTVGFTSLFTGSGTSAVIARRLIPFIIILPVILGWIRLYGEKQGYYSESTGVAGFVVVVILSFFLFILFTAGKLKKAELIRINYENDLIENEAKLKAILDNSPSAIYLKDLNNRFILVNKTTLQNHGVTENEIIGKTLSDLFPGNPDAVKGYEANDRKVIESGEALEFEESAELADGTHTYLSQKFPLRDYNGNIYAMCGVSTDITYRKNAADKIVAILEAAPDAVVIVGKDGIIQVVNKQTEKLFGFKRSELIGQKVEILIPAELHSRHGSHRDNFFNDHSVRPMGSGLELFAVKKSGEKFPVEISLSPIENNEEILVSAAIRDISERKAKDEKLKKLNVMLTESNNELESFSYSVSHDLRAPLRHIIGFGEKLRRIAAPKMSDEEQRLLNRITGSADKMGKLIDDLLMFSRVGRTGLSKAETDLNKIVDEFLTEISNSEKYADYVFEVKEIPRFYADPLQIKIVLDNLLGNAVKYSGKSEIKKIEVGGFTKDGENIFYVKDSGCGFDMEYKDKLFGVFQRLHRDDEYEGTGIGLATVRRIIMRHGGKVWAESVPGKGSEFCFSLPVV
ncbi:MAG: PAS domain S-box protein [Ignavibacteria bacterium]|nr:PAS domain S-box protein [Ignavibacteria bacterium]